MSAAPDVLQQLTEGVIVRQVLPCRRAVDRYLGDLLRLGKRPRTIDTYRRCLDDFTDTLPADWDIAKVTANEVRLFLDRYNRNSPAYRAQKDSILRAFFRWLYREELIRRSPMERMQPPKRQRDEDKDVLTVSSSDVRKLLGECKDWRERITLSVLAYMGPRRHAASQLRLSDYDGGRLRFREKGGKTIWKPVPSELAQLLDAAIVAGVYESGSAGVPVRGTSLEARSLRSTLACPDPDVYLIPSNQPQRRDGDRDDRVIWRTVRAVAERAGVKAHTHALRAAFAVFYLEANPGEVESLKELMGHRSILTTQTYLRRLDRESAMERVRTLSWSLSEPGGVPPRGGPKPTPGSESDEGWRGAPGRGDSASKPVSYPVRRAHNQFESKSVAEKEGFEPSMKGNALSERPGTHPRDVDLQSDLRPKPRERR